eukprot:Hpha_TRINITY_DN9770_c0_g2::TRINITY_DN9770_c0_g2_i1::g.10379::m.10379
MYRTTCAYPPHPHLRHEAPRHRETQKWCCVKSAMSSAPGSRPWPRTRRRWNMEFGTPVQVQGAPTTFRISIPCCSTNYSVTPRQAVLPPAEYPAEPHPGVPGALDFDPLPPPPSPPRRCLLFTA